MILRILGRKSSKKEGTGPEKLWKKINNQIIGVGGISSCIYGNYYNPAFRKFLFIPVTQNILKPQGKRECSISPTISYYRFRRK